MQSYVYLIAAILLEVSGTTCMKLSEGFEKIIPSVFMGFFYVLSFGALTLALKKIDVSVAYAVWSGVGTAAISIIGVTYFREPVSIVKFGSIAFIILGVVGLHLSGTHE